MEASGGPGDHRLTPEVDCKQPHYGCPVVAAADAGDAYVAVVVAAAAVDAVVVAAAVAEVAPSQRWRRSSRTCRSRVRQRLGLRSGLLLGMTFHRRRRKLGRKIRQG